MRVFGVNGRLRLPCVVVLCLSVVLLLAYVNVFSLRRWWHVQPTETMQGPNHHSKLPVSDELGRRPGGGPPEPLDKRKPSHSVHLTLEEPLEALNYTSEGGDNQPGGLQQTIQQALEQIEPNLQTAGESVPKAVDGPTPSPSPSPSRDQQTLVGLEHTLTKPTKSLLHSEKQPSQNLTQPVKQGKLSAEEAGIEGMPQDDFDLQLLNVSRKHEHKPNSDEITTATVVREESEPTQLCASGQIVSRKSDIPPYYSEDPKDLRIWIEAANREQRVLNEDLFGPASNSTQIIVVQVHKRAHYLRWLLRSLSRVRGIESALLVLSHDVVDEELLSIARSVCFCRVTRVFFPYSLQAYPSADFPGLAGPTPDPGTSNSTTPKSTSGHRDPVHLIAKHHWWWLHNYVFGDLAKKLRIDISGTGGALFLEEDQYASPDMLHVLKLMRKTAQADVYTMNDNAGKIDQTSSSQAVISSWFYNMGVSLSDVTWRKVSACAEYFCNYNDYNWDWTMQALGRKCFSEGLTTMVLRGARVFHTGKCGGMHFKDGRDGENCDVLIRGVQKQLNATQSSLFPESLTVWRSKVSGRLGSPNGGWEDARDRQLCLNISRSAGYAASTENYSG